METGDSWGPVSSQPSLFGELQAVEKKQRGQTLKVYSVS